MTTPSETPPEPSPAPLEEIPSGMNPPANPSTQSPVLSPVSHASPDQVTQAGAEASRHLLLFWCLWLLGSWVVTLTLYGAVPAVRWMMIACLVGYSLIWPVLRLSQADLVGAKPAGRIASNWRILWRIWRDWLSLFVILQAVVWPLRVTAHWSLEQAGWLIGGLGGWSLLIGAIIAWGCLSSRAWRRMAAMVLCVLALLGEPAWIGLIGRGKISWEPIFSPLTLIWHLAGLPVDWMAHMWSGRVTALCMAAVALWVLLLVFAGWPRRHRIADDPLSISR